MQGAFLRFTYREESCAQAYPQKLGRGNQPEVEDGLPAWNEMYRACFEGSPHVAADSQPQFALCRSCDERSQKKSAVDGDSYQCAERGDGLDGSPQVISGARFAGTG